MLQQAYSICLNIYMFLSAGLNDCIEIVGTGPPFIIFQLGYSTGMFQALQLIVPCLVLCINHLPIERCYFLEYLVLRDNLAESLA